MAGLRDQLLKSGLVDERQVKKVQKDKIKAQRSGMEDSSKTDAALASKYQEQLRAKAERDRQLNLERNLEKTRHEAEAQIRQLILAHQVAEPDADIPYQFNHAGRIKKIMVSENQKRRLAKGILGITFLDDRYAMVPRETIERIRARSETAVVLLNPLTEANPPVGGEDPYAAYTIPDDLMW